MKKINVLTILTILLSACSESEIQTNPTAGLIKIGEGYALGAGAKVELWAREELFTGYNQLYVALYDSIGGERITESHVYLQPFMSMDGGMKHACPAINPKDENAVNELFPAVAIFTMPSSELNYSNLGISVHNHRTEKFGTASLDIAVASPTVPRLKSFVTADNEKIVVAYHFPSPAKVGVNDIELAIYKMEYSDSFIPQADYAIALQPEMPAMEHGSPNNVDPIFDDTEGVYAGKVNFTMTGQWRMNLTLVKGEQEQPLYFDVDLE